MNLPDTIYRYRSIRTDGKHWHDLLERESKAILEKYLWFSKFEDLNDPMESYHNPKSDYSICSFSTRSDNMMLWSLYAKNTGIFIGYNTEALLSHPDVKDIIEVQYNYRKTLTSGTNVKFEEWQGEQEIRLLSKKAGILSFEMNSNLITDLHLAVNFGLLPNGQQCHNSTNFLKLCRSKDIAVRPFPLGHAQ